MRLLIVGTLNGQLTTATKIAMDKGATVTHAADNAQALAVLRSGRGADLLMVDVAIDIRALVTALEAEHIHAPIVACGTATDARAAVAAIHAGAKEYIPLPPDAELIAAVLAAVADDTRDLIYRDDALARVVKLAQQIAASEASVLITGESGTGKEVLARYVHARSGRSKKPLVCVNCAAIPETLLESELFGHEKGSFTGAIARRIGKFEEANGGTLLLDEISELAPLLQAKLLRVLQQREFERLGGDRLLPFNARVLAATNKNLEEAIKTGEFRQDLYYRLNVVSVAMPPLREHREDIPLLTLYFANKYAEKCHRGFTGIAVEARELLMKYSWPGNVRELENAIEHAIVLGLTDEILAEDLPDTLLEEQSVGLAAARYHNTLSQTKKQLVLTALDETNGNHVEAARLLGIHPKYLHRLIRNLNLNSAVKRQGET